MTHDEYKAHLAALPEPVREAREGLPAHAQEVLNWPRDLHEYVSECALNSFRASLDLLTECCSDWEQEAEDLCEGRTWESWREYTEVLGEIVYQISVRETVREALEAYRDTLESFDDGHEGDEAFYERHEAAVARDLDAIATILG